jgi:hypothetical protein
LFATGGHSSFKCQFGMHIATLNQIKSIISFLCLLHLFYFIDFTFTYMCIPHLSPPHPQFCWREKVRDNKKDITFLLVWDKDSHTERFLVLLPCTYVLHPTLVRSYKSSLLLPGPLPVVVSANLRLLYLLLNREHINHIQVLDFLSFPYSSHVRSPLSVWPMSNNITAFVYLFWVYNSHMRENIWFLAFLGWLTLLKMFFISIHLLVNDKISFFVAE